MKTNRYAWCHSAPLHWLHEVQNMHLMVAGAANRILSSPPVCIKYYYYPSWLATDRRGPSTLDEAPLCNVHPVHFLFSLAAHLQTTWGKQNNVGRWKSSSVHLSIILPSSHDRLPLIMTTISTISTNPTNSTRRHVMMTTILQRCTHWQMHIFLMIVKVIHQKTAPSSMMILSAPTIHLLVLTCLMMLGRVHHPHQHSNFNWNYFDDTIKLINEYTSSCDFDTNDPLYSCKQCWANRLVGSKKRFLSSLWTWHWLCNIISSCANKFDCVPIVCHWRYWGWWEHVCHNIAKAALEQILWRPDSTKL